MGREEKRINEMDEIQKDTVSEMTDEEKLARFDPKPQPATSVGSILKAFLAVVVFTIVFALIGRTLTERWGLSREDIRPQVELKKPVLYLHPTEETDVLVTIPETHQVEISYPVYAEGWLMTAKEDGSLVDAEGDVYP